GGAIAFGAVASWAWTRSSAWSTCAATSRSAGTSSRCSRAPRACPAPSCSSRPALRPGAMLAAMTHPDTAAGPTRALGADFAAPITDRYFEDYQPGAVYEYGYLTVTEAEILDFARRFDPQPMHADQDWAQAGPFGGLIASGWHTAGLFMRLYADHYLTRVASLASPGIDELRWPAPLRPGDLLRIRATVAEARP